MPKVHSHYENLKVARHATPDEIRAAYRALTRKHHPDRNPGNPDAERVMAMINVAYGVLSDPARRSEHDRWIAQTEAPPPPVRLVRGKPTVHAPSARYQHPAGPASPAERAERLRRRQAVFDRRARRAAAHLRRHRIAYALALVAALGLAGLWLATLFEPGIGTTLVAPRAADVASAAAPPAADLTPVAGYARAASAPNGQRWPARSGYVDGYRQLNRSGQSEVVVDNSHNDNDMFAKLVSLDGPTPQPVRTFFVAARTRFTLAGVTTGTYDLRYRNLASGGLLRSPAFILEEVATTRGTTQHSATTVPLYSHADGSLQTYSLGDSEF